jgi:glycosyltransferase involved in cell wall biosynthesis
MLPVKNRYPEEWYHQFRKGYEDYGVDFVYVEPTEGWQIPFERDATKGWFAPTVDASLWEIEQARIFVETILPKLTEDDVLFFADLDFPGFSLPIAHLARLTQPRVGLYGYLHAGSYCNRDLFSSVPGKLQTEVGMLNTYDGIFVGSDYHREKLYGALGGEGLENVYIVPPPFYLKQLGKVKRKRYDQRKYDVAFTSRIDAQKTSKELRFLAEKNPDIEFAVTIQVKTGLSDLPNIQFVPVSNRKEYYSVLANSLTYLSTAEEETFGYGAVEAMSLGTIPVLPNRLSYPELVRIVGGRRFFYSTVEEASDVLRKAIVYASMMVEPIEYDLSTFELSIRRMLEIMVP